MMLIVEADTPRRPEATALLQASQAYLQTLYPPE